MEYCESCKGVLHEVYNLENKVASLMSKLLIAQTQLKLLRDENDLLKSNIKVPNKQRRAKKGTSGELQQCYQEIEKLRVIIEHKDEIIQSKDRG